MDLQYTAAGPELYYTVSFTSTGTYYLWLRGYAPNAAGDSVYVALDNQTTAVLTGFAPRTWSWANRSDQGLSVTVEITQPGFHTLRIRPREDGVRLDRILLTLDSGYNPDGAGPSESQRF